MSNDYLTSLVTRDEESGFDLQPRLYSEFEPMAEERFSPEPISEEVYEVVTSPPRRPSVSLAAFAPEESLRVAPPPTENQPTPRLPAPQAPESWPTESVAPPVIRRKPLPDNAPQELPEPVQPTVAIPALPAQPPTPPAPKLPVPLEPLTQHVAPLLEHYPIRQESASPQLPNSNEARIPLPTESQEMSLLPSERIVETVRQARLLRQTVREMQEHWQTVMLPAEAKPQLVAPDNDSALLQPQIFPLFAPQLEEPFARAEKPLAPPAPTINVTIGRIDVRATAPSAQTTERRAGTAAPTMSLDDYLRQRGGQR